MEAKEEISMREGLMVMDEGMKNASIYKCGGLF